MDKSSHWSGYFSSSDDELWTRRVSLALTEFLANVPSSPAVNLAELLVPRQWQYSVQNRNILKPIDRSDSVETVLVGRILSTAMVVLDRN